MPIIIEHERTGGRYVLVGAGYGLAATASTGHFLRDSLPSEPGYDRTLVAACDRDGRIAWFPCSDVRVVEVDGVPPAEIPGLSELPGSAPAPFVKTEIRNVPAFECSTCNTVSTQVSASGACLECGAIVKRFV